MNTPTDYTRSDEFLAEAIKAPSQIVAYVLRDLLTELQQRRQATAAIWTPDGKLRLSDRTYDALADQLGRHTLDAALEGIAESAELDTYAPAETTSERP